MGYLGRAGGLSSGGSLTQEDALHLVEWTVATDSEQRERTREERVRAKAAAYLEERQAREALADR